MRRSSIGLAILGIWLAAFVFVVRAGAAGQTAAPASGAAQTSPGWRIPASATTEKNPLTVDETLISSGKKLFAAKCQRCHGTTAKGDGEDADPAHQADMDLTVSSRAIRNPDGVVFYKIWNGRASPKMPVFSEELSKEQVWAIVAYVQTLRVKP